ncbi:MAG: GNAT family N-acetyltransferase [Chloroflexi bacterium]|nr:GNAT family N-acetyltransferase [Chloroflexota bacterium]
MKSRNYNPETDKAATHRIWHEAGWSDNSDDDKAAIDVFLSGSRALIAELNGAAESIAAAMPGTIRYLDSDLALSAVTTVITSRVARKQGFAKRLTAQLVANEAVNGAQVSALGIFEQGYYDQLGFGTGSYEHWIGFDPTQLRLKNKARIPRRLTKGDWRIMHQAMLARQRTHGGVNLTPERLMQGEISMSKDDFGLGYEDGRNGELSHFFWCRAKGMRGPYTILFMAYQNWDQFLELMALIRTLGDQVRLVEMREPGYIQIQDLIAQPFRYRQLTRKSEYENANRATAYWQARICDLPGCLEKTQLGGTAVRFNLNLHDPIAEHLDEKAPWRGIGGEYVVTLGAESKAQKGKEVGLPTLTASVGAFTRMWLGVRPASGLAVTDQLSGPLELVAALDQILCLPEPKPDWDI